MSDRDGWEPYDPDVGYRKAFCDVRLRDGSIVRGRWPNAGKFGPGMPGASTEFIPERRVAEVCYLDEAEWERRMEASRAPRREG